MRPAMKAASSFTKPMSADPRVCCQGSPMKNTPGASVTPRRWTMPPSLSLIEGTSIHEKSDRYPVAQMIASTPCSLPSSNTARRPDGTREPPPQRDTGAPQAPRARPDEHVALRQLPTESRIGAHLHEPHAGEPPEEILAEETLRQGRNALTDGEADLPRRRQFLGDLEPGVPPSHDEHLAIGQLGRVAVVSAMDLDDRVVEVARNGRNEGDLERAGRNDDLLRRELLVRGRHDVSPSGFGERRDLRYRASPEDRTQPRTTRGTRRRRLSSGTCPSARERPCPGARCIARG